MTMAKLTKSLALFSILLISGLSIADPRQADMDAVEYEQQAKKVIMFSATYCPNCLHAKNYLSSKNIPFLEFDIEKSVAARTYFDKLGGRGTPFLLVNNQPIQGFNQKEFWRLYQK
mgnify:CR=1 FL=1